jgi:hypothetical protein
MANIETFPPYKIVLNLNIDFATMYKKINEFNKTYEEKLIKVYALSEPNRITQFEFNGDVYSKELNSYTKNDTSITEEEYNTAILNYRADEEEKLKNEKYAVSNILYVSSDTHRYQVTTLYNEIMCQMNSYATKHKRSYTVASDGSYSSCSDIFYFEDTIVPMNVFASLRKEYPYFMDYVDTLELRNSSDTTLVTFKRLQEPTIEL